MTRRRWIMIAGAACALAVTALPTGRLRHLALPVVHDPSVHATPPQLAIAEGNRALDGSERALEHTRLPGRISAILPRADGVVFIGTFDCGLWRFDPAHDPMPRQVGALDGRERFVDALIEWRGRIVAGTHRGAIVLAPDGTRTGVLAAGQAVSSLAIADDELIAGTAHGLWRGSDDLPVGERGPEGETLRVTALAAAGDRVWIGTPDGVYAIATPLHAQVAMWHPLVFGSPGSTSNVVTALAAVGATVVAGTDDGGLVVVSDAGVEAAPFADKRANDVNPGALAFAGGALFVGTEGAGLVALDAARTHAHRVGAPARISAVAVTVGSRTVAIGAVAVGARLWFGSEEGALYSIALPVALTAAAARAPSSARAPG